VLTARVVTAGMKAKDDGGQWGGDGGCESRGELNQVMAWMDRKG
jgi:hypothetical protein